MREGVDYIFVTKNVITTLVDKYRSTDKDCLLNYKRFGVL